MVIRSLRYILLLLPLLTLLSGARAEDNSGASTGAWSPPVHGLRARLFTTPNKDPQVDKTFDVWIEFEETGIDSSLGMQHRAITVRFGRPNFVVTITTPKHQNINATSREGTDEVASWDLIFPPSGRIAFPIGAGGSRPHVVLGQTPAKARLLSFDTQSEYAIPMENGPYRLAITFQVSSTGQAANAAPAPSADGEAGAPPPAGSWTNKIAAPTAPAETDPTAATYRGWSGELDLPPLDLPAQ